MEFHDTSTTRLNSLSEAEFARWRQREGSRIICHRDRYWQEARRGFYTTIHLLACLDAEEATRPTALSWGFRATLNEAAAARGNGSVPINLLTDLETFDQQATPAFRRKVRQCLKQVQIVEVTGPALLREQGWEVAASSLARVGGEFQTKEQYQGSLDRYVNPERRLVLAGLVDAKLAGYLVCHAVDGSAYIEFAYYATEWLSTNVSTGLLHEFIEICRRSPGIRQVVHGLHTPELEGLSHYKTQAGFRVEKIPARVEINPIMAALIRWRRPSAFYRLTGQTDQAA